MGSNVFQFPTSKGVDVVTVADGADHLGIASEIADRMSDAHKQQAANRFLWLLGDLAVGAEAEAVRQAAMIDATEDPSLLMWLHLPTAHEFVERFASDDWSIYEVTALFKNEGWAHSVIQRARSLVDEGNDSAMWLEIVRLRT